MNRLQLRKEVLEMETINPELKEQFQKEIHSMVEKPLKPWERLLAVILMPVGIGLSLFCGGLLFCADPAFSGLIRAEVGVVSFISTLMAVWAFFVVKQGRHLRNDLITPVVAFGFFVAMIAVSIAMTGSVDADLLAATMVVGFVFVWERVKIAELNIRENILRQELRLAQLSEQLERLRIRPDSKSQL